MIYVALHLDCTLNNQVKIKYQVNSSLMIVSMSLPAFFTHFCFSFDSTVQSETEICGTDAETLDNAELVTMQMTKVVML